MFTVVERRETATATGALPVLVVSPRMHVRMGATRIDLLEVTRGESSIDLEIVGHVERSGLERCALVFCARSPDGTGSWGYDERLSDAEADEMGYRVVRAQLPTYRRLVAMGVAAVAHAGFGAREVRTLRQGVARRLAELSAKEEPPSAEGTDAEILRERVCYHTETCAEVVARILPGRVARRGGRRAAARRL